MSRGRHTRSRGTLPRLMAWLRPELLWLVIVAAVSLLSVAAMTAGPALLGSATNILFDGIIGKSLPADTTKAQAVARLRDQGHTQLADMFAAAHFTPGVGVDFTRLGQVLGLAALGYVLASVFFWAQGYIMAGIAQRTVYRLRQAVEEKLGRLPLRYFDSHPHGDILSRVTNDIDNLSSTLQTGLSQVLNSVFTLLGLLAAMFWISPELSAVALVTIPLAALATAVIARRSKPRFKGMWEQTGQLNGFVEESHTGHALILAFGQREAMTEEFDRQNSRLRETNFRAWFLPDVIPSAVLFLSNLNYVVIVVLGGFQVATGVLSFGAAQAFVQYSRRFALPIGQIAGQMNALQSGLASAERVFGFLDTPEESTIRERLRDAGPIPGGRVPVAGWLQFQRVSFRYEPDRPLIDDFTLDVAPGQMVAIVGPTGAGKTTVVNLLMRFYEIDRGRILLDGVDYRCLGRDQVRRCFGMVLQDTWLFGGTIRDNIMYGKEDASEEDMLAAARAAHIDEFVRTLPDGYATILDGEASGISSGQRQLLTIARAFLADPAILILDEATSNVDTRTEAMIQDAMVRLRSGRTSFVIAHRLSTIRNADTIVVMNAGRIVEQGCHEDLLSCRGFYYDLYNSQFAGSSLIRLWVVALEVRPQRPPARHRSSAHADLQVGIGGVYPVGRVICGERTTASEVGPELIERADLEHRPVGSTARAPRPVGVLARENRRQVVGRTENLKRGRLRIVAGEDRGRRPTGAGEHRVLGRDRLGELRPADGVHHRRVRPADARHLVQVGDRQDRKQRDEGRQHADHGGGEHEPAPQSGAFAAGDPALSGHATRGKHRGHHPVAVVRLPRHPDEHIHEDEGGCHGDEPKLGLPPEPDEAGDDHRYHQQAAVEHLVGQAEDVVADGAARLVQQGRHGQFRPAVRGLPDQVRHPDHPRDRPAEPGPPGP
jgi:ABC-type multidrug transport system fused ATPase/permease subunit